MIRIPHLGEATRNMTHWFRHSILHRSMCRDLNLTRLMACQVRRVRLMGLNTNQRHLPHRMTHQRAKVQRKMRWFRRSRRYKSSSTGLIRLPLSQCLTNKGSMMEWMSHRHRLLIRIHRSA